MTNKKFIMTLILGIFVIAVGSLVMNHSDSVLKILMVVAGLATVIDGILTLVNVRKWKFESTTKTLSEIRGYESILSGLGAIVIAIFLNAAITIMVYIFSFSLLFSAIVSFQNAFVAKHFNIADRRSYFLLEALVKILVAIILICNPVGSLMSIAKIVGIIVVVLGALIVAFSVIMKLKSKNNQVIGEAEIVED